VTSEGRANHRATINDVATAAAVSRQTVSNAVNAPEKVAPNTLKKVLAEIERLGFRPSRAAKTLKQERAGALGIELNTMGFGRLGAVIDTFLVELTARSRRHDAYVVPFTAKDPVNPLDAYEDIVASRIADGFVLTDTRHDDPRPAWLAARHIPFASFGRVWDDPSVTTWVDVDGAAGVSDAVRHLVEAGFERIGWLGWPEGSPVGDDRRSGWARTTEELGVAHPEWQAHAEQQLDAAAAAAAPLIDRLGRGRRGLEGTARARDGARHRLRARRLRRHRPRARPRPDHPATAARRRGRHRAADARLGHPHPRSGGARRPAHPPAGRPGQLNPCGRPHRSEREVR
jgi:DNA-binding LacI/PurR family transcriptional regulator